MAVDLIFFSMHKKYRLILIVFIANLCVTISGRAELKWNSDTQEHQLPVGERKHLFVFTFRNASEREIVIRQVRSSCGCTVPKLTKTNYAAGEEGSILVEFDAGRRQGNVEKSVVVEYDDGTISTKQLKVRAQIPNLSQFEPAQLEWKLGGSLEEKSIVVTLNPEIEFDIVDVGTTNETFNVTLKVIEPRRRYLVKVQPSNVSSPAKASISLTTTLQKVQKLYYTAEIR